MLSSTKDYPGYIALSIVKGERNNKKKYEVTDLILKEFDKSALPYHTFFEDMDTKEWGKNRLEIVNHKRQPVSQILLRSDHITPSTILKSGGFQPHCLPKSNSLYYFRGDLPILLLKM